MNNILELAASVGGIGGLFAVVMFFVYRRTTSQMRDDRKYMEDRLTNVLNDYNKAITENTKASSELVTLLRTLNGRLK